MNDCQCCYIFFVILNIIAIFSLGILAVCYYDHCGWDKNICMADNSEIFEKTGFVYELYTDLYSDESCWWKEKTLVEKSDNKTYLIYLRDNVYIDNSPHNCWTRYSGCPYYLELPDYSKLVEELSYATLACFILLFFPSLIGFCLTHDFRFIENHKYNYIINPSAPPPLHFPPPYSN
jgi:hypothetical protein